MPTELETQQLAHIQALLRAHPEGMSITDVATAIGTNRNSTARYLDILTREGRVDERTIGTTKLYTLATGEPFAIQLELFKRAMDEASCGITIADARLPDMPLVYINKAFETITGYAREDVLGKNCRFLQGKNTKQPAIARIRKAISAGQALSVTLTNFRKDGTSFANQLHLAPIVSEGVVTHYVGIQTPLPQKKQ